MPIYSSLDRLNAMHDLFTAQGNAKLDAGEVDALAGFYSGLPPQSRGKIEKRLVDILDTTKMASGQRARFSELLATAGLNVTAAPQVEDTRSIALSDIPISARAKIKTEVKAWTQDKKAEIRAADGYDPKMDSVGVPSYEAALNAQGKVVGYQVSIPVYQADHDVGMRLGFDLKGRLVDQTYIGE